LWENEKVLGGKKKYSTTSLDQAHQILRFFFLNFKVRSLLIDHSDNWWQGAA
jgi:hypothetical protein